MRRGAAVNDLGEEDAGFVADVRVVHAARYGEAEAHAAPLQVNLLIIPLKLFRH